MAFQCKVGTITAPASGTTTVVTGVGFQPLALMFIGFDNGFDFGACKVSMGFDDGTTRGGQSVNSGIGSFGLHIADTVGSDTYSILRAQNFASTPAALRVAGYVSALSADGFTAHWDVLDGVATKFIYVAFGGTINAKVGILHSNTLASQTVSGLGFSPKGVLSCFGALNSGTNEYPGGGQGNQFGCGTPCGSQGGLLTAYTADSPANARSKLVAPATFDATGLGTISAYTSDGFTIAWAPIKGTTSPFWVYLALGGSVALNVGMITSPTGVGSQTVTIPGVPKALILASNDNPSASGFSDNFFFNVGASDGTAQANMWAEDAKGSGTYKQHYQLSTTAILSMRKAIGDYSSQLQAEASLAGFGSGSFTLNWTTVLAGSGGNAVLYVALVDADAGDPCGSAPPPCLVPPPTIPTVTTGPIGGGSAVTGSDGVIVP